MTSSVMEKAKIESDRDSILWVVMTNLSPGEEERAIFQRLISFRSETVNCGLDVEYLLQKLQ